MTEYLFARSTDLITGPASGITFTPAGGLSSTNVQAALEELDAEKLSGTGTLGADHGGTGIANNIASTIAIAGAFALTITISGVTGVTFPTAGTLATLTGAETFSNKTLTAPKFATGGFIADANGNELLILTTTAAAVNEVTLANGATGVNPKLTASGETNVGLDFQAKGTGVYNFYATASQAAEIRIYEITGSGTNYTAFKVPALAANITYTLPPDDGNSGDLLRTDGSGVLTWVAATGGGDVSAAANFSNDNRLIRSDGTLKGVQASGITIDDSDNMSLGVSASLTVGTLELGHATQNTLSASGGTLSIEGVPLKQAGIETIYVPAAAMISRTTNGPSGGLVEMTTNKNMFKTYDYDTTTQEFAQFAIRMPKSWNEGTVTAVFTWSHAATTTNFGVVWALEAVATSDDDAGDVAWGTAQQIADTGGTTNDIYVSGATPALTVGGTPAAEDLVMFQVKRVPADGSDTMAIDARLHGVTLYITTDAKNDA